MAIRKSDVVLSGSYGTDTAKKSGVLAVKGTYTVTSDTEIGDVIQMCPVPAGAVILDIKMNATGGTTNMTASIGDGTTVARFKAAAANAGAVQFVANLNLGYEYAASDTIDIVTAVAAPTADSVYVMTVMYFLG